MNNQGQVMGYCVLGVITGLGAVAAAAYETATRVTGTSSMLGIGRVGGLVGISIGASMIEAGWTLGPVLAGMSIAVVLCFLGIVCLPDVDVFVFRARNLAVANDEEQAMRFAKPGDGNVRLFQK